MTDRSRNLKENAWKLCLLSQVKFLFTFWKISHIFENPFTFFPLFFFLKKERRAKAAKVNWQKNAWSRLSWKSRGSVCAHLFAKPSYSHTQKDLWNSRKTGLATCFSTDTSKTSSCGQVWRRQDLLGLPAVKPKTRECAWRDAWSKSDERLLASKGGKWATSTGI